MEMTVSENLNIPVRAKKTMLDGKATKIDSRGPESGCNGL
jgi:hypothetical protein